MAKKPSESRPSADSLRESELFLQKVIENASGVPFRLIFGPTPGTGHYSYIGSGIERLLGIPASEFTEKRYGEITEEVLHLLPNIPSDPVECRKKMLSGEISHYNADIRVRTPQGVVRWLNDSSLPMHDTATGKIIGAYGILIDITDRKKMEHALRDSEERFRTLFESMMDGVYRSTHEGRFLDVNPAMVRMFGFSSREEMLSVDIKSQLYFAPEDRESLFLDTGQEKIEIFPMRRKDGSAIWVEDHGHYVHDGKGNVIFHEGILRDVTERMKTERALADWKQRFELVAGASRQVVYDYNPVTGTIAWSGSVKQVLGYESDEMNGGINQWMEFIDPQDRNDALRLLEEAEKNRTPYEVEYGFRHRDGHYIQMHDLGFFLTDGSAKSVRMIGVMQDVTERKRAAILQNAVYEIAQAADRVETLDDLYGSVHEIVSTVMPAKNFYIALYDAEKDLIRFPYFVDEIDTPPTTGKIDKSLTGYVLRSGKSLLVDEKVDADLRSRGEVELIGVPSPIWLGVPLNIGNHTIGAMVVQHYKDPLAYGEREQHMLEFVSTQIAKAIEHKRAEEKLRQSEEQFRLISENVADLIAVVDLNGKRLYNSPSYRALLDANQLEQGTDSFEEVHPDDRERIRTILRETVQTGNGQRTEYRILTKDGSIRYIESQVSVIKDKDGVVTNVLIVARDITEKKKLEQQFLRSQRMESLGTLAGGIAHDLNNVLAPIMLSIQVLRNKISDTDALKILETLSLSAKRGSDVVKQVLAFARGIEGERMILQATHLLSEAIKIANETFPKSIEIRSEIPKNLWTISADPTQIHQVLLNILVNARDAMPYGGKISIGAENVLLDENYSRMHLEAKPGQHLRISITDNGTGIPPNVIDKIFEPFFTTKEFGKGTGLGLSTVIAIVKSHGGFVDVYSEVGRGTTFKIYLPAQISETEVHQEEKPPDFPRGNGECILVVDDESSVREITRDTLETYGYKVLTANDGTEALALYAQHQGDIKLVITDMMMPFLDGMATIRALQKINPRVLIIASSGMSPNEELMKNTGMVKEFLNKPYTTEKLLKSLHMVLTASPVKAEQLTERS